MTHDGETHRPQDDELIGPRAMFWMWMSTVIVGFVLMTAVVVSGH